MPNNCLMIYKIVGLKEDISALFHKLYTLYEITDTYRTKYVNAIRKNRPLPAKPPEVLNGNSQLDLCDIVNYFGGDSSKVNCSGYVEGFELLDDTTIKISTDTAYLPMQDVWDIVIAEYESLKYFFSSEEIGSECFYNSDRSGMYFSDRYFIDNRFGGETECADSVDFLLNYMSQWLEVGEITTIIDLDIWIDIFNEDHPNETIRYFEYMHPKPNVPSLKATYRTRSERLRVYHYDKCIIDVSVDNEDYWNSLTVNSGVYDVNLYQDVDGNYSLCLYEVYDNKVDCSVWQNIKLLVLPI